MLPWQQSLNPESPPPPERYSDYNWSTFLLRTYVFSALSRKMALRYSVHVILIGV
jgi:hypothetical protein